MMLGLSYLRIGIYAAGLALIGYLAWREHSLTRKLAEVRVENRSLSNTITTERAARAHELANAKKASDEYQAELDRIRAAPDLGVVRLCPPPPRVPAPAQGGTARGSDARAAGHVEKPDASDPEAGRDVGPQLSDFVEDCEANAAQLEKLQQWERDR
jgi:hypothetical protein